MKLGYECLTVDKGTEARRGRVTTLHGTVETPVFMPVGTQGTVKGLTTRELEDLGIEILLGNTYHLYLRPGTEVIEALGGLHEMMKWKGAILTDSGGFQVFSLRDISKIKEEGVLFSSHLDGSKHLLTPEKSLAIQETLGSDIVMAFDHCPPAQAPRKVVIDALERTTRWAERMISARDKEHYQLFGIIQGGVDFDLRKRAIKEITALPFDGFALGGLSVGEPRDVMWECIRQVTPLMPKDKARYLMGVGTPEDLLVSVGHGIDMFDCVLPTRNARNGKVFTKTGDINLRNAKYKMDTKPIEEGCQCYTCKTGFSRGYLRHLSRAKEILFASLASIHNLHFLLELMRDIRLAIERQEYSEFRDHVLKERGIAPGL